MSRSRSLRRVGGLKSSRCTATRQPARTVIVRHLTKCSRMHRHAFDVIVVWALDRLSREGMSRTVQLIEMLERMGIGVISYSEPYLDTTNELARNILLAVVSTLAKAERERISERTRAGLARVKRSGKKLGRPGVDSKKRTQAVKLLKMGYSIRQAAHKLGVSRSSVFNWRKGVRSRH